MPARVRSRRRTPAPVSESLQRLGDRLRKARTEAGLSQSQLGAPHFTRAYVSALELGKIRPAMKSLEFLAAKLGKPTSFFVEDEEQERTRRERELDLDAAAALLARPTAAEALSRITRLLETSSGAEDACRLRLMAGTAHNFLAQSTEAMKDLAVAERLAEQLPDVDLQRSVLHQTAIALRGLGDLTRAQDLLRRLLTSVESSSGGDLLLRMKLLKDLGALSWDLGEHEKASAYYESALEWAKDIGDVAGLIAIYNGLAYTRRSLGDLDGATAYLQRALGAAQVSNDLAAAAVMHNALAILAAERGHNAAAHRHVDRAIELSRVIGPQSYVAHYLNTKAACYLKGGDPSAAAATATDALDLADRTENARAAAAARVNLADAASRAERMDEALHRLEEATVIYRKIGAKQELGEVLMRLSGMAAERGDVASAQRYARQAFEATKTGSGLMER